MEKHTLLEIHKEQLQALRVNYYPPCRLSDKVFGLSPHSDTSTITILMQDDNVTGLQIRHREGWVPVKPIPNALVVNVGGVIEVHYYSVLRNKYEPVIRNLLKVTSTTCFNSIKKLAMKFDHV